MTWRLLDARRRALGSHVTNDVSMSPEMSRTYLHVSYAEKDRAKALGARWDPDERKWYVTADLNLVAFQEWLPADAVAAQPEPLVALPASSSTEALAPARGVSLSQLLGTVEQVIRNTFPAVVWVRVEILGIHGKNGHLYLELTERSPNGSVMAKARGIIWSQTADDIVPKFQRATGAQLAPGIKLLVQARPVFKPQFDFSLHISDIDPSYTLGDLEAQKRKIREALVAEKVFDNNRRLTPPWDFFRVLVVSPEGAAGLGDFAAEANRLHQHGVCEFTYVHSRFQGEGAALEILEALQRGLESVGDDLDAIIVIRGGGAVNDLAWLNSYELARFICVCGIPVLTGIGHERDSTLLDEVAHRSFDTPSKVIAGVEQHVLMRARQASENFDAVLGSSQWTIERARSSIARLIGQISSASRDSVAEAKRLCTGHLVGLGGDAVRHLNRASSDSKDLLVEVKLSARNHIDQAKHGVPVAFAEVRSSATLALRQARSDIDAALPLVLTQSNNAVRTVTRSLRHEIDAVAERARNRVGKARADAEALYREIVGQGPEKTLARGFAMVSSVDGTTVTSTKAASEAKSIEIRFRDGKTSAIVNR